jgi:Mg-chelatase subunit ChlD
LGNRRLEALDTFVRDGGGLIVAGGDATFEAERYRDTALQRLLPVRAGTAPPQTRRNIAIVLVIDKSKSMREENRLGLAKEAAKRTVDLKLLTEQDKVGILAFGDDTEWISPVVPCDNRAELKRRIDGLQATGLTNMYPALQRAFLAISEAHADRRHVIVLTDGVPSPGDFGRIAEQMSEAGITMSTVSVGAGADRTILKDIARRAGGDHEHCESAEELPEALVKQARSAATAELEYFKPLVARQLPGLSVKTAPPLTGYASTGGKARSEQLLLIGAGDPLLAWWRYGAGVAVAFTSAGGPGQAWQSWPGYADFWRRLATLVRRQRRPQLYDVRIRRTDGHGRLVLNAASSEGAWLNGSSPEIHVRPAATSTVEAVAIPQVAPGRYARDFAVAESQQRLKLTTTWSNNDNAAQRTHRALTVDYPDELQLGPSNESLLRDVAAVSAGMYQPSPDQVFADDGRMVQRITPLWRYFVLASLIVFVIDVGLRRWLV